MDGDLTRAFRELLRSGEFSDLTLVCGDREFKVHKVVLYAQSEYFKKLLGSGFKESTQNTITLHDDDSDVLEVLIKYLYRHNPNLTRLDTKPMAFTVKVYAIADKYNISSLRMQSANRFASILNPTIDMVDFIDAIKLVNACSPPGDRTLWDSVVKVTRAHMTFLLEKYEFVTLVQEMPELLTGLLGLLNTSAEPASGYENGGGRTLGW